MAATARQGNQNPQTPFFGCKISLISKSEIRYEGILYTIDPQESTIALAKVRSFGSEDRPVERPVPPRDDVFEFIIFRASDIKDLIVDDPPPQSQPQLQDPAIIQVNNQSTSFPSSFPQGSISHAVPTGPAPVVSAPLAQVPKPTPQLQHPQSTQQQKAAKPQPSSQQAGGDTQTDAPTVKLTKPTASNVAGAQGYAKVAGGGVLPQQQKQPVQRQQPQPQSSVPFNQARQQKQPGEQQASAPGTGPLNQRPTRPGQQQPPNLGQNGFMNRRGPQDQNAPQNRVLGEGQNPNFQARNGGPGAHQQQGFRPYNQRFQRGGFHQGGPQQYGGFRRGGPGGFNGPRTFNTRQPGTGLSAHPNGPKFPPLPDGDFDFEKAQADFKILEEKLNALKLNGAVGDGGDGADSSEVLVPGIPVSAISVAALEQEDVSAEPCYNKTKSFFDAISCEALEREKGSMNRVDWKQERKLNRETFGVVSARRPTFFRVNNRGGGFGGYHNHRGGYQNRGPGGYSQNRYQQNRGPRPTSNSSNGNNVSSTTNGGAPGSQRTPAKASPGASNGVAASPAPIAAKN